MNFISICLNPAIDVTMRLDSLIPDEPARPTSERLYAGGKAVNAARTLAALGEDSSLFGIAGRENYHIFSGLLDRDKVDCGFVLTDGGIRENLTICLGDGTLYKINRQGFAACRDDLDRLSGMVFSQTVKTTETVHIYSGSLPTGITADDLTTMMTKSEESGALVVYDGTALDFDRLKALDPFVYKPNLTEFAELIGIKPASADHLAAMVRQHICARHMLISLGADGLLYSGKDGMYKADVPHVPVRSTVGAGDACLACFLHAIATGTDIQDCIAMAAAGGTAKTMLDGTETIGRNNVRPLIDEIRVRKI
ncbi:MAG: PfkB family carbohydrate kinase [Oscillospiraceae bacterium]|nr:PfkB family carbohydrate kinase [Oscillospiraceae bacterium]